MRSRFPDTVRPKPVAAFNAAHRRLARSSLDGSVKIRRVCKASLPSAQVFRKIHLKPAGMSPRCAGHGAFIRSFQTEQAAFCCAKPLNRLLCLQITHVDCLAFILC